MKTSFKTLNEVVKHLLQCEKPFPIMLRGRHGCGKSEFIYQIAKKIDLKVVERRASQMTEGDVLGLPIISSDNDSTSWKLPDWYIECCNEPRLLFLDEIDRASMEVRQAIFELGDSRKIAGHKLHPQTRMFAACNSGEHDQAQFYQVSSLDPAELDRWWGAEVDPTIGDWVEWATDNEILDDIIEFVTDSQIEGKNVLEHTGQFEDNKIYPSRRSWVRLSDTLKTSPSYIKSIPQEQFINLCYGFLGDEVAIAFNNFLRSTSRAEAYEQIIEKGNVDYSKDWSTSQHILFINRIVKSNLIKKMVPTTIIENLAKYYKILTNELGVKLWSSMGDSIVSSRKDLDNEVAIYNFFRLNRIRIDGESISHYFIQQFTPFDDSNDVLDEEESENNE